MPTWISQLKLHRLLPKQRRTSAYLSFNDSIQTRAHADPKLAKGELKLNPIVNWTSRFVQRSRFAAAGFWVWASNKLLPPNIEQMQKSGKIGKTASVKNAHKMFLLTRTIPTSRGPRWCFGEGRTDSMGPNEKSNLSWSQSFKKLRVTGICPDLTGNFSKLWKKIYSV